MALSTEKKKIISQTPYIDTAQLCKTYKQTGFLEEKHVFI